MARQIGVKGAVGEAPLDQLGDTVADHLDELLERQGSQAEFGAQIVERLGHIGRRVHQGTVQIQKESAGHRRALSGITSKATEMRVPTPSKGTVR